MPETDVSLVIKAIDKSMDGFSSAKRSAKDYERSLSDLDKKARDLKERNEGLRKVWADGAAAMSSAKKEAKALGEAYEKSGDAADKEKWTKAIREQDELASALKSARKEMAENERAIASLGREAGKLTAKTGGGSGKGGDGGGALDGVNAAMSAIGKQVGSALTSAAGTWLGSALGSQDSAMLSGILSGGASGFSAGLMSGNPLVAVGGLLAGAGAGAIQGLAQQYGQKDEFFKAYRDQAISEAQTAVASKLDAGSATAAGRESDVLAFASLLGGEDRAQEILGGIVTMANRTPYQYDDLTTVAKSLSVYGYGKEPGKDMLGTLTAIGNAGSAIGWSTSDQAQVAQYLGFMGSLSNVETEQLKSLQSRGLAVYDWLSEYYGVDRTKLQEMISKRQVGGAEASNEILRRMGLTYEGSMERQAGTFAGLSSTVAGLTDEVGAQMGVGYNSARMSGLQAREEFLSGSGGAAMGFVNEAIGRANAIRDNYKDALQDEIQSAIFDGGELTTVDEKTALEVERLRSEYLSAFEDYKNGDEQAQMDAGAKMQSILEQSTVLAEEAAEISPKMDSWDEAAISTAKGVGEIVNTLKSWQDPWSINRTGDVGRAGSGELLTEAEKAEARRQTTGGFLGTRDFKPRAVGQHTIPYNNFPILAHEGEMLLTAQEARQYQGRKKGADLRGIFAGAVFNVRTDSDIEAIAAKLAERLEWAEMTAS